LNYFLSQGDLGRVRIRDPIYQRSDPDPPTLDHDMMSNLA
jgi:hypothetical protein